MTESKPSSIFPGKDIEYVKADALMSPTWIIIVTLVIVMVALKSFIYIKDKKRHNK